jgi:hypothetical protein
LTLHEVFPDPQTGAVMSSEWSSIQAILASTMFAVAGGKLLHTWFIRRRARARDRQALQHRLEVAIGAGDLDRAARLWRDVHGGTLTAAKRQVESLAPAARAPDH